jgi:hypothetical protein
VGPWSTGPSGVMCASWLLAAASLDHLALGIRSLVGGAVVGGAVVGGAVVGGAVVGGVSGAMWARRRDETRP